MKSLAAAVFLFFVFAGNPYAEEVALSPETRSCLNCHRALTPGIVKDWEESRHAKTTPEDALKKPELEKTVSASGFKEGLLKTAVGCFECHGLNTERHKDGFGHFGFKINVVVSIADCSECHPREAKEYSMSKKAHAIGNLRKNPVYHALVETIIGPKETDGASIASGEPSEHTRQEACFGCHGTDMKAEGLKNINTKLGTIQVPALTGWPNQGVGRINPDGSMGSCTACHPRHSFSIEVARKPHTCGQCHLEPDVPAYNVYKESKHGNIYSSKHDEWDFGAVPWKLGEDFTAPTCAACHVSLVVAPDGGPIAARSHDFGRRLWVRLFGLPYSHPQPKGGDTSVIRNKDGLPLPTSFDGEPAGEFLIDKGEEARRKETMKAVCRGCHSLSWTESHFERFENTLRETDDMTLQATKLLLRAWEEGLEDKGNPFDEKIERMWVKQWLFYANSTRYASAMTGAFDYAAFKYGWWGLSSNLVEMLDAIKTKGAMKEEEER